MENMNSGIEESNIVFSSSICLVIGRVFTERLGNVLNEPLHITASVIVYLGLFIMYSRGNFIVRLSF